MSVSVSVSVSGGFVSGFVIGFDIGFDIVQLYSARLIEAKTQSQQMHQ